MAKIGAYKLFVKQRLSLEYYSGDIELEDLIHLKKIISKEPSYDFSFTTIFDMRDANIIINESEMKLLLKFLSTQFKKGDPRCVAYLTNSPNDVVKSTLFSMLLDSNKNLNIIPKIFSEISSIAKWLDTKNINKEELGTMLNLLKLQPTNVL